MKNTAPNPTSIKNPHTKAQSINFSSVVYIGVGEGSGEASGARCSGLFEGKGAMSGASCECCGGVDTCVVDVVHSDGCLGVLLSSS